MTMIHAENADCIGWLTEQLLEAGLTAPRYHAHARPMLVEREATHRAIALAELIDVPILIVHVSGREAVEQIRAASLGSACSVRDSRSSTSPTRNKSTSKPKTTATAPATNFFTPPVAGALSAIVVTPLSV